MSVLTDNRLATLARVLGYSYLDRDGDEWVCSSPMSVGVLSFCSDWDLIGALLLKLRERGATFAVTTQGVTFARDKWIDWTTPTDLLAAIADACEGVK